MTGKKPISSNEYGAFVLFVDSSHEPMIREKIACQINTTKRRLAKWVDSMGANIKYHFSDPVIELKTLKNSDPLNSSYFISWKMLMNGRTFVMKRLDSWGNLGLRQKPKHKDKKCVPKRKRGKTIFKIKQKKTWYSRKMDWERNEI